MATFLKINKIQIPFYILFALCFTTQNIFALTTDESSVLTFDTSHPLVDYPETVINKNIILSHKFDFSLDLISKTDDLFYDNIHGSFKLSYYINDDNGIGLQYIKSNENTNQYSKQFEQSTARLNFSRAPLSKSLTSLFFNQVYFYGKISVTNELVINQIWMGRYSAGVNQYDTGSYLPFIGGSLHVQNYFTKNVYFELGYGISLNQIFNPVSKNIRESAAVTTKNDFNKEIQFSQNFNLGLGFNI